MCFFILNLARPEHLSQANILPINSSDMALARLALAQL